MASCYLSFRECERLYARVVRDGDPRAYMKLSDHAIAGLTRHLSRRCSRAVPAWQLEDLSAAGFSKAALAFARIPTWGQAIRYARRVSRSLLKRWAARALLPARLDRDPPDPRSLAFLRGIELEDFLIRLGKLLNATETAHMAYLVKAAWFGRQRPATLAGELQVSERTMERQRPRVLRKLAVLLRDLS